MQMYSIRNIESTIPTVSSLIGNSPTTLQSTYVNGAGGIYGVLGAGTASAISQWAGASQDYTVLNAVTPSDFRRFSAAKYEALNDEIRSVTATIAGYTNRMVGAVWT